MKPHAPALLLAIPLALRLCALAQHQTFKVNPEPSQVAFSLGGNTHHVQGTFHVQSGSIDFDPSAQRISGSVIVAAASGNSSEPSRDKKMTTDVLDTDHFAEVHVCAQQLSGNDRALRRLHDPGLRRLYAARHAA